MTLMSDCDQHPSEDTLTKALSVLGPGWRGNFINEMEMVIIWKITEVSSHLTRGN